MVDESERCEYHYTKGRILRLGPTEGSLKYIYPFDGKKNFLHFDL